MDKCVREPEIEQNEQAMSAFEICVAQMLDECEIEIVENGSLPVVVDQRNPYYMQIVFKNGLWWCDAKYQSKDNPDEYVHIRRCFSPELLTELSMFYNGKNEDDG